LLGATDCASAKLTAFRDPAYPDRRFNKIAVFALGMYLENATAIEGQVCEKVAPAPCVPGKQVLPPTRNYSNAEASEYLGIAKVDGILIIVLGDDQSASRYLGSIASTSASSSGTQSGSANVYGNSAVWNASSQGTASAQSVATPVYGYSRTAHAAVALFERATGAVVWRGEMKVSGQGEVNISDKSFIRAATNELASQLKNGLLIP
jgi:hypothetical protein